MGRDVSIPSVSEDRCGGLAARLRARLEQAENQLPVLPAGVARVLAACRDPQCDPQTVADLAQREPDLCAHVLRIANSAAYAPAEPIVSVGHAVSRLGMATTGAIAVSAALQGQFFRAPGHEQRLAAVWGHCAATAAWAAEVARLRRRNVERAFLCGLLHDAGRAVALREAARLEQEGTALREAELDHALDVLHEEVGARLLARWSLPACAVAAAATHHAPRLGEPHLDEVLCVAFADHVAHRAAAGADLARDLQGHPLAVALGLYDDELARLAARAERVERQRETVA